MQTQGTDGKAEYEIDQSVLFKITPAMLAELQSKHETRVAAFQAWYNQSSPANQRKLDLIAATVQDRLHQARAEYEFGDLDVDDFIHAEVKEIIGLAAILREHFLFLTRADTGECRDHALAFLDAAAERLRNNPS